MAFENRYLVSKARLAEWARHPINRKRYLLFKAFWGVMFILTSGFAVYYFLSANVFYVSFGVLLALFCIYRLFFRDRVSSSRQYKVMAQAHGASEWERVVTFGEKVLARDGNTTAEYAYDQFNSLVEDGDYLAFGMGKGWKALYLRLSKNGFGEKTFQEFVDFIRREHPHIEIRNMT